MYIPDRILYSWCPRPWEDADNNIRCTVIKPSIYKYLVTLFFLNLLIYDKTIFAFYKVIESLLIAHFQPKQSHSKALRVFILKSNIFLIFIIFFFFFWISWILYVDTKYIIGTIYSASTTLINYKYLYHDIYLMYLMIWTVVNLFSIYKKKKNNNTFETTLCLEGLFLFKRNLL